MTRIIFVVNIEIGMMYIIDDPRSIRELIKLINTGALKVGEGEVRVEGLSQWAVGHPTVHAITVLFGEAPVALSARLYDVLYGIADGKLAAEIGQDLGITPRTVYEYTALLKERFGVRSKEEMILKALKTGILCNEYSIEFEDDLPEEPESPTG